MTFWKRQNNGYNKKISDCQNKVMVGGWVGGDEGMSRQSTEDLKNAV